MTKGAIPLDSSHQFHQTPNPIRSLPYFRREPPLPSQTPQAVSNFHPRPAGILHVISDGPSTSTSTGELVNGVAGRVWAY